MCTWPSPVDISSGTACHEATNPERYSVCSAEIGETDAARTAGMIAAISEQTASAPAASVNASGSQEETP